MDRPHSSGFTRGYQNPRLRRCGQIHGGHAIATGRGMMHRGSENDV